MPTTIGFVPVSEGCVGATYGMAWLRAVAIGMLLDRYSLLFAMLGNDSSEREVPGASETKSKKMTICDYQIELGRVSTRCKQETRLDLDLSKYHLVELSGKVSST